MSQICREHGISIPTFHNWKSKYSGMGVNQLKKLMEMEVENARLKKMYAELLLVHLRCSRKKAVRSDKKKQMVVYMQETD